MLNPTAADLMDRCAVLSGNLGEILPRRKEACVAHPVCDVSFLLPYDAEALAANLRAQELMSRCPGIWESEEDALDKKKKSGLFGD